jgi:hypothetical protein
MINSGVGGYFDFYVPNTTLTIDAPVGATSINVASTSQFPSTGTLHVGGTNHTYTVVNATTFTISALGAAIRIGDLVQELHILRIPGLSGVPSNIAISDAIDIYTNINSGNM